MKIAYLGPKGTFTEAIALKACPRAKLIPLLPIRKVIMAVEEGKADLGIVPLENFYNGEVRETLDTLNECKKTKIIQELSEKVILCLGCLNECKEIKLIVSKDQALEQASKYLYKNYPSARTLAMPSTAEAIKEIKSSNLKDAAVIAQENALISAGFKILAKDICPKNKTRFVVIGRGVAKKTGNDKTFISIHPEIKDKPGVLYHTLGFFSGFGINLEYIQSRPDGKNGYYFYVELEGHIHDKAVKKALESIKFSLDPANKFPKTLKFLGSYKNTNWKE